MGMHCRGYMRVLVPSTQALPEVGSAPSLVCSRFILFETRWLTRWAGVLSDATKSVSRAYINNFQDKGKQVAIDMFLVRLRFPGPDPFKLLIAEQGNLNNQTQVTIFDPIHDSVRAALDAR